MATSQLFFSVQGTGGSPTGPDAENRVGGQYTEAQVGQFLLGCKCPMSQGIVVKEQDHFGDLPAALFLQNVLHFEGHFEGKKLAYIGFQYFAHPTYSPDLAPLEYHLFPGLKKQLKGRHFSSDVDVTAAAETWLDGQPSE